MWLKWKNPIKQKTKDIIGFTDYNIIMKKENILFLCTGNSCRSQMAEGWCRHLQGDKYEAYSAGIETHGLNPNAIKVMTESGVDISTHKSQLIGDIAQLHFDIIVTVCGHANEHCPLVTNATKVIHVGFDDPPALAKTAKNSEEALDHYRKVRDQIKKFVAAMPESLSI